MRTLARFGCVLLLVCAAAAPSAAQHWYRGNTHTHTLNSDGDSSPYDVAAWYKSWGYDFLFITDHNVLTSVAALNAQLGGGGSFLVIAGEEDTDNYSTLPVHLVALNPSRVVYPRGGSTVLQTMQNDADAIRAAGGVPIVCHPNFRQSGTDPALSITPANLAALHGVSLFEMHNALVGDGPPGADIPVEQKWDEVLSAGRLLYGVACDDEHKLRGPTAWPGQAWVMVRAAALTPSEIVSALARGDFYSTTGVTLEDVRATPTSLTVTSLLDDGSGCDPELICAPRPNRVEFIGKGGRVLKTTSENPAVYQFAGDELYVRARISDGMGHTAWTQPVFFGKSIDVESVVNAALPDPSLARGRALAPGDIAVLTGANFAATAVQARPLPDGKFPLELNGARVTVAGQPAPVYYVSPTQLNFFIPPATPPGNSEVVVTNAKGLESRLTLTLQSAAPALFTQDGTGKGEAVTYDLLRELPFITNGDGLRRVIIFATGLGGAGVTATANGQPVAVEAVRPSPTLPGLTQIHLAFPPGVGAGGAPVTVVVRANGADSNAVTVRF